MLLLGVNIDHVATLRQARHAGDLDSPNAEPDLIAAGRAAIDGGADSITIHLREDRRHIQDDDVRRVQDELDTKLNLEMGNTQGILDIALEVKPDFVCLVPESREEITTEGGLDAAGQIDALRPTIETLQENGIAVSLFIDPVPAQVEAASNLGAEMIELHTGAFANSFGADREKMVGDLTAAAIQAHGLGLQVNAGHGINSGNLADLFRVPHLAEFNIGHHLVSRAITVGLKTAVAEMRAAMNAYSAA